MIRTLQAEWIGEGVAELQLNPGELRILGDTSKGIFLRHQSNRVIFLSQEPYRGPLSIILKQSNPFQVSDDARSEITSDRITISREIQVDLLSARVWKPVPWDMRVIRSIDPMIIRTIRLMSVSQKKEESLFNRLPLLPGDPDLQNSADKPLIDRFQPILQDLSVAQVDQQVTQLLRAIGFGRGLTPSGDDFLCGIILGMARYGISLTKLPGFSLLKESLLPAAFEKTTLVSANIMEFAFRGQTDERIITGLDEMLSENPSLSRIESTLLTWGNTSGLDTLAGLLVLLKAIGKII